MKQEFRDGGVIVDRTRLVDLAVETLEGRRVVVLHVDEGEDVADGVGDGQVGAELAAVAGVAGGDLGTFRHETDHEVGPK